MLACLRADSIRKAGGHVSRSEALSAAKERLLALVAELAERLRAADVLTVSEEIEVCAEQIAEAAKALNQGEPAPPPVQIVSEDPAIEVIAYRLDPEPPTWFVGYEIVRVFDPIGASNEDHLIRGLQYVNGQRKQRAEIVDVDGLALDAAGTDERMVPMPEWELGETLLVPEDLSFEKRMILRGLEKWDRYLRTIHKLGDPLFTAPPEDLEDLRPDVPGGSARLTIGRVEVEPETCSVHIGDGSWTVKRGKQWDVLCRLLKGDGLRVTVDQLLASVWSDEIVARQSVHQQIYKLRGSLKNSELCGRLEIDSPERGSYRVLVIGG